MGAGGGRGPVFGAERTQPGCDRHQSHPHSRLLLPVLVDSHPGPGQPPVWPSAEE